MLLNSILTPERTRVKIQSASKKRALESLAQVFADNIDSIDADELFQNFISRERLGSTGIGHGIAIPHCRFNTGGETYCACVTLNDAIDFDSVDNEPVDVIFAMLVPEDAQASHLQTLATIAEALQKPKYVSQLRKSKTEEELYNCAIST